MILRSIMLLPVGVASDCGAAVEEEPEGRIFGLMPERIVERLQRRLEALPLGRRHHDAGQHATMVGAMVTVVE